MQRIEREHDAHDRLGELRIADLRDAAARDAVVRVTVGQSQGRAAQVDDDLVGLVQREMFEGHRAVDANHYVGAARARNHTQ
jgi:hypothetical protein